MTARARPAVERHPGLRVIVGRGRPRPSIGTWIMFTLLAVGLFFALILSRIALDAPAMELHELSRQIEGEKTRYQELRLEVARLQAPDRILQQAEQIGLVRPDDIRILIADTGEPPPENRWAEVKSMLTASP